MHEMFSRPSVRPRRYAPRRLDDRLLRWEEDHPMLAEAACYGIVSLACLFVAWVMVVGIL